MSTWPVGSGRRRFIAICWARPRRRPASRGPTASPGPSYRRYHIFTLSRKDFKGYFGSPGCHPGGTSFLYSSRGIPEVDEVAAIGLAVGHGQEDRLQVELVACTGPRAPSPVQEEPRPAQGQHSSSMYKESKACSGPAQLEVKEVQETQGLLRANAAVPERIRASTRPVTARACSGPRTAGLLRTRADAAKSRKPEGLLRARRWNPARSAVSCHLRSQQMQQPDGVASQGTRPARSARRSVDQPSSWWRPQAIARRKGGLGQFGTYEGLRYQIEVGSTFRKLGQKVHLTCKRLELSIVVC